MIEIVLLKQGMSCIECWMRYLVLKLDTTIAFAIHHFTFPLECTLKLSYPSGVFFFTISSVLWWNILQIQFSLAHHHYESFYFHGSFFACLCITNREACFCTLQTELTEDNSLCLWHFLDGVLFNLPTCACLVLVLTIFWKCSSLLRWKFSVMVPIRVIGSFCEHDRDLIANENNEQIWDSWTGWILWM